MSRDTLFYVLMAMLAVGLALLVFNHDAGRTFGLANEEFGQLVLLTALATAFSAGLLRRGRFATTLRYGLIWLLLLLVFAVGYLYRYDLQSVATRLSAGLVPGSAITRQGADGQAEVVIHKALGGHFMAEAEVNGEAVDFLVDTGASIVALTWQDAARLGLDPDTLTFDRTVMTANGPARAASVRLDEIMIGGIARRNVLATVSEDGMLPTSLLGMNFLGELSSFEIRRDELILRE